MTLETEKQGRWLARRVLFKLGKAGTEACRADETHRGQSGALRTALRKLLLTGTREAHSGFACVLTDALGTRGCYPGELACFYERMECEGRFRQWHDTKGETADNVPEQAGREPDARQGRAGTLTIARELRRPRDTPLQG